MDTPIVSFIVPCYKLAHLLRECVDSILSQSFSALEILIMDDCSPDDTPEVARSLTDGRLRYIRNARNLGHLANYNKGIELSRGKYIWLISADDRLRKPYVLERYVRLMEAHPNVGFICCPGIGLEDGKETKLLKCGFFGSKDRLFSGPQFIESSLHRGYGLLAPSVMVRKDCYDNIANFPIDMPHQGDWYLWFRWALEREVAYCSEPMVNYRSHDLNIMKEFKRRAPEVIFRDEVNVLWRTRSDCRQRGYPRLYNMCEEVVTSKYAEALVAHSYPDIRPAKQLTRAECNAELRAYAAGTGEYRRLQGKTLAYVGNQHWRHGDFHSAFQAYTDALRAHKTMPSVWLKLIFLLAGLGRPGLWFKSLKWHRQRDLISQ